MKELSVNLYPKKSRLRAAEPQIIKDIRDLTVCKVSAHEGDKNGSLTVSKKERAAAIPICKTL
jgi:hypothetical protein